MTNLLERTISVHFAHRIFFTRTIFSPQNPLLAQILTPPASGPAARALVVLDEGVAKARPDLAGQITSWFSHAPAQLQLVGPPLLLPGGEAVKSEAVVGELHRLIAEHGLCRHSYLIAIGGGALLDVAGYAAATAHRGLRHVRLPTTTLSQADGGVGVKNGINAFGKKNFLGTFAPPFAVVNDADFLARLPPEEKRAGLIEAVKVALIRDADFFATIEASAKRLAAFDMEALESTILRSAEWHVRHIAEAGDPFEFGSARPLDFGHWAAHKLEQLSGFTLSHGAAVAVGLALDAIYSHRTSLLTRQAMDRVLSLLAQLGFALFHPLLEKTDSAGQLVLLGGLQEFREHLGGTLTITLLQDIGCGVEVHEIDAAIMQACVEELARRFRPA